MKLSICLGSTLIVILLALLAGGLEYQERVKDFDKLKIEMADLISEKDACMSEYARYAKIIFEYDVELIELKAENEKLKAEIRELLTIENQSKEHITNYILEYYKKVPPVLAREIAKVTLDKSTEHNVAFQIIIAVMEVESNFDPFSVSKLKTDPARGLMQVRYNVWKETLGIKSAYKLHSITGGIDAGTRVLRKYLDDTENDLNKTLYKYVGKNKAYVGLVYAKMGKFTAFISSN